MEQDPLTGAQADHQEKASKLLADDDSECEHLVKVIFVGDASVGKTCMLERLANNHFNKHTQPTIGTDFKFKRYVVDGKTVGVTLWDTAGAERYAAMTASYYRGVHGVVLVFDVTRRETLLALENRWLPDLEHHVTSPDVVKLIIGNKTDLEAAREVTPEEGARLARQHNCMYKETSAARMEEDSVHDALVWGLLSNVMDSPALLRQGFGHEKLNVELPQPPPAHRQGGWRCCG